MLLRIWHILYTFIVVVQAIDYDVDDPGTVLTTLIHNPITYLRT